MVEQLNQAFVHGRVCRCWHGFRLRSSGFPNFLPAAQSVLKVTPTMQHNLRHLGWRWLRSESSRIVGTVGTKDMFLFR